MSKIELGKPKTITLCFVGEETHLEFDSQFCVSLDRKQLQEVRDYCDRAMQVLMERESRDRS